MADYGLKIFDASGNVTLDVTDRITRLVYTTTVAAGANGSVDLPNISGKLTGLVSFSLEANLQKCAHAITRSGTVVSWTAQSGTYYTSAASVIFVFMFT